MRPSNPGRLRAPVLFFHIAALALTLGPPLFFAVAVAPAAFRVLPTRDMAAALASPILSRACAIAEVAFVVLFLTSWWLTRGGGSRLQRSLLTRLPIAGFFAALVVRQLLIPPMDRIRQQAPGLIDTLPAADPARLMLDRYHRLATGLFAAMIVAAVAVLFLTTRLISAWRAAPPSPGPPDPVSVPKLLDLS